MSTSTNLNDPKWDDYYPEPSVFERTETPGVYRFQFVSRTTGDRKEVRCRWNELRYQHQVVMDSEDVKEILDADRTA